VAVTLAEVRPFPDCRLGLVALAVIAVAARVHGLGHTLHYDEAWVANSLLAPSVSEMLFYESWAQTTPPGFLLLSRLIVMTLGASNLAFQLLPLVAGLLGVGVITLLGWREFSPARGLWIGLLAALSGPQVAFSKEAKQYSVEFLAGALLLAFFLRRPANAWKPAAALGAAFAFSPASITFLPAVWVAWRPAWRVAAVWSAGTALVAVGLMILFYWPNRTPDLFQYWRPCFPNWEDPAGVARLVWLDVKTIFAGGFPTHAAVRWGALLIALQGTLRGWPSPRVALALVPAGLAVAANLAGQYPLCETRFTAFLFPGVLLLHGLAWDFPAPAWLRHSALSLTLAGGLWVAFQPSRWPPRLSAGVEDGVRHLAQHMDPAADILFVHGVAQEEYQLYARLQRFAPADVIIGQTGVGCCPRHLDWHRALNDDAFLRDEFERVIARGTARRIWFLHIRQGSMGEQRQEEPIHRAMLAEKGCRRELQHESNGTLLSAYRCPL
jgi:hypothetical protein